MGSTSLRRTPVGGVESWGIRLSFICHKGLLALITLTEASRGTHASSWGQKERFPARGVGVKRQEGQGTLALPELQHLEWCSAPLHPSCIIVEVMLQVRS